MEKVIEISGRQYLVVHFRSDNRHASARLRGCKIIIKVPRRWHQDPEKTAHELEQKAIKNIEEGRWKDKEMRKIEFVPGQEFEIFGRRFRIKDHTN